MGCSIAYNLASRGVTGILLLEQDVLGAGATGRSTALLVEKTTTRLTPESLSSKRPASRPQSSPNTKPER